LVRHNGCRKDLSDPAFTFTRQRCTAVLLAASKLKSSFRSLYIECLPLECFWATEIPALVREGLSEAFDVLEGIETTKQTMSKVEWLSLGLGTNLGTNHHDAPCPYPDDNWIFLTKQPGNWLGCFQNLRYLKLSLQWQETHLYLAFMEDLQTVLSTVTFPQFVQLRLEYLTFRQPEILPFILNHSSTLRYLRIGPRDCLPEGEGDNGAKRSLTKTSGQMKKLEKSSTRTWLTGHSRSTNNTDTWQ
jgi:hypothetical protein